MNKRRDFLKKTTLAGVALTTVPSFGFHMIKKPELKGEIIGHGDYTYRVNENWAQIGLSKPLLNCHEMVMDSKGRLIMIGDHTDNNILIFDKSGKILDYWGSAYPGGHGLSIANEGEEDFLYLTDCGWYQDKAGQWKRQSGRISKTTTDGKVLFDIGHPQTIGIYKPGDYFQPTETAIGPNGDIYVADGYGMDYIIQYSAKGEYIRHWGGHDNTNENYNLSNAHGVAIDYRDAKNSMVVCTSRNDKAFKFFTLDGVYIKTLTLPNMQVCRPVFDDKNLYAGVCWSEPKDKSIKANEGHTGFMTILEGDRVVSNPGGTEPTYKNGKLQDSYQLSTKPILHGHDVCIDEDKNVYVCQWNANRTPPLMLERV